MTTRLVGLRAESFKRLTVVDVQFGDEGGVFSIMGPNEAGKSSLLDALEVAIAGRKAPKIARPIHTGEDTARVIATFDDIIVTRTYKGNGTTTIDVKAADGRRVAAAEDLLRSLYSHVALDPLAFSRLSDAEQVAVLLPMIGFDPTPLDHERDAAFDTRTDVNREVKALEARLAAFPPVDRSLPEKEVSIAELSDDLARGLGVNSERRRLEELIAGVTMRTDANQQRIADLEAQITRIRESMDEDAHAATDARTQLATLTAVDTDAIHANLQDAETLNDRIRSQHERMRVAAELADKRGESEELTMKLSDIRDRRQAALAAAKMPVPGLSIDEESGVLTLDGVPFSQASTGVKIRTGTAIAMSLNPDLRVIVIRDASLLDAGNRAVIDELAKANGFLVLMEIADETMPVGVVIEEGTVREVRTDNTKEN